MPRFLKSTDALIFGGLILVGLAVRGPALAEQLRAKFIARPAAPADVQNADSQTVEQPVPNGPAPAATPQPGELVRNPQPEFFQRVPSHRFAGGPARFGGGFHRCGH